MASRRRDQMTIAVPVVVTLLIHLGLAGGIDAAGEYAYDVWLKRERKTIVEFEVEKPKPPKAKPPEPPKPKPKPEVKKEPPPVEEKKVVKRIAKIEEPKPDPPPSEEPPPKEELAPDPANDDPDEVYEGEAYKLPSTEGTINAPRGSGRGVQGGKKGGKGDGKKGGGGPDDSKGTAVASVASIKEPAFPIGKDTDYMSVKDYPEDARRAGIEGPVTVRLKVEADGTVSQVVLVKGLGHGLDQYALKIGKKLRFRPAITTSGQKVASWVPWTFKFRIPE